MKYIQGFLSRTMIQQTYDNRKLCFLLPPKETDVDNYHMFFSECDDYILEFGQMHKFYAQFSKTF